MSNLARVTQKYREEFIRVHDRLLALFQNQFENYAYHSEKMRAEFRERKGRFPLLHRNGGYYLVSPASERMARIGEDQLPRFGPYR